MYLRHIRLFAPILFCISLGLLLAVSHYGTAASDTHTGRPDQVVLSVEPTPGDAVLQTIGSAYLSPVTEAANPFTHMMLRWEVVQPPGAELDLSVRASADGQAWTDWGTVAEDADLWMPNDGETIHWSQVIYAGVDARFWQVRANSSPGADGRMPDLQGIEVNTVDGRYSADRQEAPVASQSDASAGTAAINKPRVVSRTSWGCPDGQGSRVKPVYYPVKHMVVHHTADANEPRGNESNWGDRVRAIWSFHTFTRGWGDVGYNYLVAPNGAIYEGRSGGDDAVGFHDAANYGSMGVAMIGTYNNGVPTRVAQNSLVDLLAWKANQKDIDPLGRSYYYGCDISKNCPASGAIVQNIAGHRQTRSGTECPGDQLHALLPRIRNRVMERFGVIGQPPDNGDLLIDELEEAGFSRSTANWYDGACGYGDHTYYSFATDTTTQSANEAVWRPNIPTAGRYHIYAHIPQGCGLASPPYATQQARYRIYHAGGETERVVDHNTAEEWVDLGAYDFRAGTDGYVLLNDLTDEPLSERKIIFFDSIKWVPEEKVEASIELLNVTYEPPTIAAGELLKVTFTVRNNGSVAISGQNPQASMLSDGSFDRYVYDEGECFLGASGQDYPVYPKQTGYFRVTLGPNNRIVPCAGNTGGYPWRWGIDGTLEPGQTRDIVGYVRFRDVGPVNLQAGVIQEYVRYHAEGAAATSITIQPEQFSPVVASFDANLQPQASVYQLGAVPDNLLARTRNPLSIPRGEYIGSFAWDGQTMDWGEGGPLNQIDLRDRFLIEQTRIFIAPASGEYVFRTISDDGSWLWINGREVVSNHGLHETRQLTGTITLNAGPHVLAFKYFERTGLATAGYAVQAPGTTHFAAPRDGLGGNTLRLGNIFAQAPSLVLGAGDLGGNGINSIGYSWDGATWSDILISNGKPPIIQLGRLVDGQYTLYYRATDRAENISPTQKIEFVVDSDLQVERVYVPLLTR
ncbi:MAG: DUF3999 family protein [Chloroflexales bacterium]|nr:DUF3999 family protein [Chloroflexales bacterium]